MESRRVAVVTGAGTGVGRAAATALADDGWFVVVCGRRSEPLIDTLALVRDAGANGLVHPADVTDPASVAELFAAAVDAGGRVDLLFNNAGTGAPPVPMEDLTVDQWRAVVDVNLTGSFLCAQQAMAQMKRQDPRGGRIVNNGSISAQTPRPHSAPYTATKHAITGLTKSIALDGRPFDIACGQLDIGNALTEMTAPMASGIPQANGDIAVEPTMDVAEAGRAVAYMASLPLDANVLSMTVMATAMPLVGRG